jgi:hypothetical protein
MDAAKQRFQAGKRKVPPPQLSTSMMAGFSWLCQRAFYGVALPQAASMEDLTSMSSIDCNFGTSRRKDEENPAQPKLSKTQLAQNLNDKTKTE